MEKLGAEGMLVLLGTPTIESTKLYASTVKDGDPAWAGALAGESLGLPSYHITEPEIKAQIDADTYDVEVGLADIALDTEEIALAVREIRGD